jgi:hypothetical protein
MAINNININPATAVVEVIVPGPPGPPGVAGPTGSFPNTGNYTLTGSLGVSGSFTLAGPVIIEGASTSSYLHAQASASNLWSVSHSLNYDYPNITVYDLDKNVIIPQEIQSTSTSSIRIIFPSPERGYAFLSIGSDAPIPSTIVEQNNNVFSPASIVFGF